MSIFINQESWDCFGKSVSELFNIDYQSSTYTEPNIIPHNVIGHGNLLCKIWAEENSPYRTEEYISNHSEAMKLAHDNPNSKFDKNWKQKIKEKNSALWNDSNSIYNTVEYRNKLSISGSNAMKNKWAANNSPLRNKDVLDKLTKQCKINSDNNSKKCIVTNPEGVEMVIKNLQQFCKDNNLIPQSMGQVALGHRKSHKGWKCAYVA